MEKLHKTFDVIVVGAGTGGREEVLLPGLLLKAD